MRKLIILLCLLAAVAMAQLTSIPPCDSYGPPQNFDFGVFIAEIPRFAVPGAPEQYGCLLPFSGVTEEYVGIYEDSGHTVLSDYVHFTGFGSDSLMYLYSEVERVPLEPPLGTVFSAELTEIGSEGLNHAIYEAGNVQYTIYSDVPEPGTSLLAGAALVLVGLLKRKLA